MRRGGFRWFSDNVSIEILQAGDALAPAEPWASMENTGSW